MKTIKYTSETGRIWEFDGEEWYCNGIEVPYATFYEQGGDREKLIPNGITKKLLSGGDDPKEVYCNTGYIYFPIIRDDKKEIVRTKTLTRITDDD